MVFLALIKQPKFSEESVNRLKFILTTKNILMPLIHIVGQFSIVKNYAGELKE